MMKNIRIAVSKLSNKKVPALALALVAVVGMVAGALAASSIVTQNSFKGEAGSYHNNTGLFTVNDQGPAVVANTASDNTTSFASTAYTSNAALTTSLTAGHWMDVITFLDNTPAVGTHVATIIFRSGAGAIGTQTGSTVTVTLTTAGTSTGTITLYIDLGTATLASPLTAYATVT
jgi:hypothetical protein